MPKTTDRSINKADLRKKQAAKLVELEARDSFERQWAMQDLTNPDYVGLAEKHASLVSDKLREAYIKKEILSQIDDEDAFEKDEDNEEDSVEDDIEFSEPEDSEEQDEPEQPSKKKPPFMQEGPDSDIDGISPKEESPAEQLGMGDLEEELSTPEDEESFGFPSEEGNEDISEDTLVPGDTDILPAPEIEETVPFGMGEAGEEEVSLEPGQDEVILDLPGGQKISVKLLENLTNKPSMEENIMAASSNKSVQDKKAARRELLASVLREASEQVESEQIKPSTEKPLGNDTSSQGKAFVMEDATRGVANPGLKGEKMTLENSGGNSLLSNPNFAQNTIPTVNSEMIANNPDAFDINKFSNEQSGLFTKKMEDTEDKLPTMGDKDLMWGSKDMIQGFELPSQLDSTQQRRTNVLAGKVVECAGCYNEDDSPLSVVACEECGNTYTLCSHCIDDDECPICASIAEENIKEAAGPNWEAYCKTPKDKAEVVEDNRGDDVNGDGGFRVKRTKDDDEGDGNYELEVNASNKVKQLEKENQQLQLALAKYAKAVETATVIAYSGSIDVTDIPTKVNEFMQDRSTNAAGLEHLKRTVAAMAKKQSQTKLAGIENGMKKGASAPRVSPAGFGYNPNPSQEKQFDHVNDMKESLKGIFSYPKKNDEE